MWRNSQIAQVPELNEHKGSNVFGTGERITISPWKPHLKVVEPFESYMALLLFELHNVKFRELTKTSYRQKTCESLTLSLSIKLIWFEDL